jgi:hypothetical protein
VVADYNVLQLATAADDRYIYAGVHSQSNEINVSPFTAVLLIVFTQASPYCGTPGLLSNQLSARQEAARP